MTTIYKENDNIYMNVVFDHSEASFVGTPIAAAVGEQPEQADYNVTKTLLILDKASNYYISIIRFDFPLDTVPLFIMPIVANQSDPNLTPLIIGISTGGTEYPVNVEFITQNISIFPPDQNQLTQVITPYYYVYSYQHMLDMINLALLHAWINAGLVDPDVTPPFFYFNPATSLINIVVSTVFTTDLSAFIYVNTPLRNYLDAFNYLFFGFNQPNGYEYQFSFVAGLSPTPDKAYYLPGTATNVPPTYYQFSQDYPTISAWTSLRKIIISTNTIPISNEYIPTGNNSNRQSGVAASFPILTDFVPNIELAGQSRSIAYYVPTSQYRLIDLISDTPLQKIDLKVYWEDTRGNLYPLLISLYQQGSIKIGFFRKSLYKQMNQLLYK
jgi:hypothetical protein